MFAMRRLEHLQMHEVGVPDLLVMWNNLDFTSG